MMSVRVRPGDPRAWDKPRVVFEGFFFQAGGPAVVNYEVAPDGKRFLMIEELASEPRLNVVQGWSRLLVDRAGPAR
jgi:hypothetical protein